MKKKILGLLAVMSTIAMANTSQGEVRIGVGYEPYRFQTNAQMKDMTRVKDGFIVGAEWLPYRTPKGWGQFGMGIEHSFGRTTFDMEIENKEPVKPNAEGSDASTTGETKAKYVRLGSTTPIYLTGKLNLISAKDLGRDTDYDLLYLTGRAGYSVNVGEQAKLDGTKGVKSTFLSGPYVGAGIGTEYKYGFAEAVYGLNYIPKSNEVFKDGNFVHKVGLTIGAKFDYKNKPLFGETNKIEQKDITFEEKHKVETVDKPTEVVLEDVKTDGFDTKGKTGTEMVESAAVKPEVKPEVVPKPVYREPEFIQGKSTIKFEYNKAVVNKDEYKNIVKTKDVLNRFKYVDVDISGHTDSRGSEKYNQRLGQKRADYVATELNKLGINDTVNIKSVKSYGETKLKNKGNTEKDHIENRRVEVDFSGWWDVNEDVVK